MEKITLATLLNILGTAHACGITNEQLARQGDLPISTLDQLTRMNEEYEEAKQMIYEKLTLALNLICIRDKNFMDRLLEHCHKKCEESVQKLNIVDTSMNGKCHVAPRDDLL